MMSTLLLALFMTSILIVAKLFMPENETQSESLSAKLSRIFSFVAISDSKFIGLIVFLISNLLTGLINLSINTLNISDLNAFLILASYSFASFSIPFLIYYQMNIDSKNIKQNCFIFLKLKKLMYRQ